MSFCYEYPPCNPDPLHITNLEIPLHRILLQIPAARGKKNILSISTLFRFILVIFLHPSFYFPTSRNPQPTAVAATQALSHLSKTLLVQRTRKHRQHFCPDPLSYARCHLTTTPQNCFVTSQQSLTPLLAPLPTSFLTRDCSSSPGISKPKTALRYPVTKGSEVHSLFSSEQSSTLIAQAHSDMSDREHFPHGDDDYCGSHPAANDPSWTQYLDHLADMEDNEIREADITARSHHHPTLSNASPETYTPTSQPSVESAQDPDRPSGGRYNAGVRALRSPASPRPSVDGGDGQVEPPKGRYNMGVRVPRAQDGPSRQGDGRADRVLEPTDSASARLEEDTADSRYGRAA